MSVGRLLRHRRIQRRSDDENEDLEYFGNNATVEELRKVIDVLYYPEISQPGDKGSYQFERDRILGEHLQQNINKFREDLIREFISYTYKRLNKHVTSTLVNRLYKDDKEDLEKDFAHRDYIIQTTCKTRNNTFS